MLQFLATSAVLGQRDYISEISFHKPLQLTLEGGSALAKILLTGFQLLWQPLAAVRSSQGAGDGLGVGQYLAEVSPDHLVELFGRGVARGAIFPFAGSEALFLASADVVSVGTQRPGAAGESALAAADQHPEQVGVLLVVAARERLVGRGFFCLPCSRR